MQRVIKGIDYLIIFCLSCFVMLIPFYRQAKKIVFIVFFLWILLNILKFKINFYKYIIPKITFGMPLLFFLISLSISTIVSIYPYHSQSILSERFLVYFSFLIFGYNMARFKNSRNIFINLFMLSSLAIGIGGLWSHLHAGGRLFSLFGININLSIFLLLYLPFNFALFIFDDNKITKLLAIVNVFLLFLCSIWHISRATLAAVVSAILVISFIKNKKIFSIIIIILIISFLFMPIGAKQRCFTAFNTLRWGDRPALWGSALEIFNDFPIFGAGLGVYEKILYKYRSIGYSESFIHLHAHSAYLEILAELGLAGILSFLAIFIVFFRNGFKRLDFSINAKINAVNIGIMGGVFAVLVFAFSSSTITVGVQGVMLFWFLLGFASRLHLGEER